nr:hypothetical protein [uncultured Clostridium sp.]
MKQPTPRKFMAHYFEYNVRDGIAEQIKCPTLICDAEDDDFFVEQAKRIYDKLHCPKEYMLFTSKEGAGDHCHVMALRLNFVRVFDWLDTVLKD